MRNKFIQNLAQALYQAQDGKSAHEVKMLAQRAAGLLAKKRLLSKSSQLFTALEAVRLKSEKKVIVTVASRIPISKTIHHEIQELMEKKFKKEVELIEKIDEEILGGMRISVDDMLIDATLNNTLKNLSQHLISN